MNDEKMPMASQMFEDYKSKYYEIYRKLATSKEKVRF